MSLSKEGKNMKIIIKWNGNKFLIEITNKTTFLELKSIIYSLTNVSIERQKIMIKGKEKLFNF